MDADPVAAAYGFFQANFAFMADRLAATVFYLARREAPGIDFDEFISRPLGPNIKELRDRLKKFRRIPAGPRGQSICDRLDTLNRWRNERAHARVDFDRTSGSLKLYSWRTRELLAMEPDEIGAESCEALKLAIALEDLLRSCLNFCDFEERLAAAFSKVDSSNLD